MKTWHIVVVVVVVIAVGVGAFFGGRAVAGGGTPTLQEALKVLQNATPQQRQAAGAGGAGGGFFGGTGGTGRAGGGGAVTGSIISSDSNSITVKTADGSTHIVLFSPSTTISKFTSASVSDLTTGQNVLVTGTTNSDGTVTATRIEVGVTLPQRQGTTPNGTAPAGGPLAPARRAAVRLNRPEAPAPPADIRSAERRPAPRYGVGRRFLL